MQISCNIIHCVLFVIIIQMFNIIYFTLVKGQKQQHTHGNMQFEGNQTLVNTISN